MSVRSASSVWLAVLVLSACRNPVNNARQAALGGDESGVRNGPLHRPGQPCTVCHSSGGGAPDFSLAGTLFVDAASTQPLAGAVVQVIENDGSQKYLTSNAAGNFYVSSDDWAPQYPLWVSVGYTCGDAAGTYVHVDMQTQIFRASACADCHFDPRGPSSAGHLYLSELAGACP